MFERFTTGARDVVARAQGEAHRLRHPGIGTSHVLLALLGTGDPTSELLLRRGVTTEAAERALARILSRDPSARDDATHEPSPDHPADDAVTAQDAAALAALGIDLARIRDAIEAAFGPGALEQVPPGAAEPPGPRRLRRLGRRRPGRPGQACEADLLRRPSPARDTHLPFGRDARRSLELSLREALRLKDRHIGTEHLLLGLLRAGDTVAVGILDLLGVDRADLRRTVEERRRRSA